MSHHWSPRTGFERLVEDVDHFIADAARRSRLAPRLLGLQPLMDVYDAGEHLVIEVLLPGAKH
jgi:HSP20 family molecular chaperone IbpA